MRIAVRSKYSKGFTLAEVALAMAVVALFGLATFATNQRLLLALRSQKETTAASLAMQWRMEMFRASAFGDIANKDWVKTNILTIRNPVDGSGNPIPDQFGNPINPFAALGSIQEQFTIGAYPPDGFTNTVLSWQSGGVTEISVNPNLLSEVTTGAVKMMKVDVLETWTSANGRQRQRQLSTIVTLGNIAGNLVQ
jgi:prepilin-type N-terminal cleavage/methylation domain-containing protein